MPATKPTSLGAVALQTGHANYANLVRCFTFLDGSGTTVTDSRNAGNLTATIGAGGGGFQTSTLPYGFQTKVSGSDPTYITGTFDYQNATSYSWFMRVKVDSISGVGAVSAAIFNSIEAYANTTKPTSVAGFHIGGDGDLHCGVGNNNGYDQITVIPNDFADGYITIGMTFDYGTRALKVYRNGVDVTTLTPTPTSTLGIGDKPGAFSNSIRDGLRLGLSHSGEMSRASLNADYDVFYIYDAALSGTDMLALHNDPYAVIASAGGGEPEISDESPDGAIVGVVGGSPVLSIDGSGSGQSYGKPADFGSAALQTNHPLYANARNIYTFLEGTGTTVNDLGTGNQDLTVVDNGDGGWQTATSPFGFTLDANDPGGNATHLSNITTFTWPYQSNWSLLVRFRVDALDPTGGYAASVIHNKTYQGNRTIQVAVEPDNTLTIGIGFQHGSRRYEGIPYTLGETVTVQFSFDFQTGNTGGIFNAWVNDVAYTAASPEYQLDADKPTSYGTPFAGGIYVGRTDDTPDRAGFDGEIDVLYIFDKAISNAEAQNLYDDPYALIGGSSAPVLWDNTAEGAVIDVVGGQPLFGGHGVMANDSGDGGPLTAEIVTQPPYGEGIVTLNPNGTAEWDTTGAGAYPAFVGVTTFTYRVFDGTEYSAPATATLTATASYAFNGEGAVVGVIGGSPVLDLISGQNNYNQLVQGAIIDVVGGQPALVTETDVIYDQQAEGAVVGVVGGQPTIGFAGLGFGYINNPGIIAISENTIFNGRNNVVEVQLTEDGQLLTDVGLRASRFVLNWNGQSVDSDTDTSVFDWDEDDGKVVLKLGSLDWPIGTGYASLIAYDDHENQNGVVFTHPNSATPLLITVGTEAGQNLATLGVINDPGWRLPVGVSPDSGLVGDDYIYLPVYLTHDNAVEILLTEQDVILKLAGRINRVTVELGTVIVDSNGNSEMFDWTARDPNGNHILRMYLGDAPLVAGQYLATLTIYDDENADGVVFVDDTSVNPLPIQVVEA